MLSQAAKTNWEAKAGTSLEAAVEAASSHPADLRERIAQAADNKAREARAEYAPGERVDVADGYGELARLIREI